MIIDYLMHPMPYARLVCTSHLHFNFHNPDLYKCQPFLFTFMGKVNEKHKRDEVSIYLCNLQKTMFSLAYNKLPKSIIIVCLENNMHSSYYLLSCLRSA